MPERSEQSLKFFFQAEDGIRDVERSRGLGDVYKRQDFSHSLATLAEILNKGRRGSPLAG